MLEKLSISLTRSFEQHKIISPEDFEIYQFGLLQIIRNLLSFSSVILAGILLNELSTCLVFIIGFTFLRKYSGGYHASTPMRCYFLTVIVTTSILLIQKYSKAATIIYFILFVCSSVLILVFSPVDSKNNRLDSIEKRYYKRKAIVNWLIEAVVSIVLIILNQMYLFEAICLALAVLSISMLVEYFIDKRITKS